MNSNKTTSAGKWSVALAVFPIAIAIAFLLLVMVPVWTGHVSGEGGLGVMLAIGVILYYGSHALVATSLLGAALGIFAIYKTTWQKGVAGLLLNISILLLVGSFLAISYHRRDIDPDRLPIAAHQGDYKTVEKLLAKGFDINRRCGDDTALSNAATAGREQIVELLLSHGADVNISNPLGKAVQWGNGNPKIVTLLLDHGADPNCLHSAVCGRHKDAVQLLLEHKADVNQKDGNGRTPLHLAVTSGCEDIIKLLISNGADVNVRNNEGETPLHMLVQMWPQNEWPDGYRKRVIEILLDAGADIEAKTRKGQTPLCMAAEAAKSNDAMMILSEHGANLTNVKDLHLRFTAVPISMGKTDAEKWVQTNTSDINVQNIRGESLLHAAVKGSNKNLVEVLVTMGAVVNVQDNVGDTPLHWAVQDPNMEVIKLLINNKADVNLQNKQGLTPLHILTKSRTIAEEKLPYQSQLEACELLLTNSAKVDIKAKDGKSALDWQQCWCPESENGLQYQKEILQLMHKYQNK
ncbi:MAG: ankyrin repeat domain-containing protein [Planctomycetota bacterium]|nr:ankyrin repeat domain-containing protein [Planctomycetota bacterium]